MKKLMLVLVAMGIVIWGGCSKDDAPPESGGTGQVKMYIVDSPSAYDAVNIVVLSVQVHQAGLDSLSGWVVVNDTPATHDLLVLRNGANAILGSATLNAGMYNQIRLLIGTGSNVVIAGVPYGLEIPSGMQTGVKLNHPFTIQPNATYELTLDFDAERSVVQTGAGQYRLKPVIRVQANQSAGSVSGTIFQPASRPEVWTNVGNDTASTIADTNGAFKLMALPEGSYSIRFVSSSAAYRDTTINGVIVQRGQNTDMGTVALPLQ